jgi:predicted DNA-binding transcriptional regulator AlpA
MSTAAAPRRLVGRRALAEHFGVCTQTISNWSRSGHIPEPIRVGPRLVLWDLEQVLAHVRTRGGAA